jgi:hypothetical protein
MNDHDDQDLRLPALKAVLILLLILVVRHGQDPVWIQAGVVVMIVSVAIYGILDPAGRIYERRARGGGSSER